MLLFKVIDQNVVGSLLPTHLLASFPKKKKPKNIPPKTFAKITDSIIVKLKNASALFQNIKWNKSFSTYM